MKPVISVIVTCYNHEKYIAKCLDGILKQKQCPEFEIVIGNDFSKDNSSKIIDRYAKKYPDKINVLKREKNLGLLGNLKDCFNSCRGKYIAICEGDDYWVDSLKLKFQYEALSKDENAYLCFNDIYLLIENSKVKHIEQVKEKLSKNISAYDFCKSGNCIGNFSCCMYKKEVLKFIPSSYWKSKYFADFTFNLLILYASKYAIFLKKRMSVYRILNDSLSHKGSILDKVFNLYEVIKGTDKLTKYKYSDLLKSMLEAFANAMLSTNFSNNMSDVLNKKLLKLKRIQHRQNKIIVVLLLLLILFSLL